jgi:altronate dehydratase small subunit
VTGTKAIVVDERDSVATALADLTAGEVVVLRVAGMEREVALRAPIAFGHKVALVTIPAGGSVVKYGEVIGRATRAIAPGEHVHVHNLESMRGRGDAP